MPEEKTGYEVPQLFVLDIPLVQFLFTSGEGTGGGGSEEVI